MLRRAASAFAAALALGGLCLLAVHLFWPQRVGPLVATQIFEPYLMLGLVVGLLGLVLLVRHSTPAVLTAALIVVLAGRYGPGLLSFPAAMPVGAQPIHVLSWNLEAGDVPVDDMVAVVDDLRPDLVGLIELTRPMSQATQGNERIQDLFPYRLMLPRGGIPGLGLLSRYPVVEHEFSANPPLLRAVVAPSDDEPPVTVFVAHPYLDGIDFFGVVPDIQTVRRDANIRLIRAAIDHELEAGNDVLVLGDFNVTEREPAYAELTRGLHDAHREAGFGFGLTWRPARFEHLPFGLLRIDYLLASPAFVALEAAPDCTPSGSDHCLVTATFARPRTR